MVRALSSPNHKLSCDISDENTKFDFVLIKEQNFFIPDFSIDYYQSDSLTCQETLPEANLRFAQLFRSTIESQNLVQTDDSPALFDITKLKSQIIPPNVTPEALAALFFVVLRGIGPVRAYSRRIGDKVYEVVEDFKNGSELRFRVRIDNQGKANLEGGVSFKDNSQEGKRTQHSIQKPKSEENEFVIEFPDGKLVQRFLIEYPWGQQGPARIRLSSDQPKNPFLAQNRKNLPQALIRFQEGRSNDRLVTLKEIEPAIPFKTDRGKGSYTLLHLSTMQTAVIFTPDDLSLNLNLYPSLVYFIDPTDPQQNNLAYSSLRPDAYPFAPSTLRYISTDSFPFEFALERPKEQRTLRGGRWQLMPSEFSYIEVLNNLGVIQNSWVKDGIRLVPTPESALILSGKLADQSVTVQFTGDVLGLRITQDHPFSIGGRIEGGKFIPDLRQKVFAPAYDSDGNVFSSPLLMMVHPFNNSDGYRMSIELREPGEKGRFVSAEPLSLGNLLGMASMRSEARVLTHLREISQTVGIDLSDQEKVENRLISPQPVFRFQEVPVGYRQSHLSTTTLITSAEIQMVGGEVLLNGEKVHRFVLFFPERGDRVEFTGILKNDPDRQPSYFFETQECKYFSSATAFPTFVSSYVDQKQNVGITVVPVNRKFSFRIHPDSFSFSINASRVPTLRGRTSYIEVIDPDWTHRHRPDTRMSREIPHLARLAEARVSETSFASPFSPPSICQADGNLALATGDVATQAAGFVERLPPDAQVVARVASETSRWDLEIAGFIREITPVLEGNESLFATTTIQRELARRPEENMREWERRITILFKDFSAIDAERLYLYYTEIRPVLERWAVIPRDLFDAGRPLEVVIQGRAFFDSPRSRAGYSSTEQSLDGSELVCKKPAPSSPTLSEKKAIADFQVKMTSLIQKDRSGFVPADLVDTVLMKLEREEGESLREYHARMRRMFVTLARRSEEEIPDEETRAFNAAEDDRIRKELERKTGETVGRWLQRVSTVSLTRSRREKSASQASKSSPPNWILTYDQLFFYPLERLKKQIPRDERIDDEGYMLGSQSYSDAGAGYGRLIKALPSSDRQWEGLGVRYTPALAQRFNPYAHVYRAAPPRDISTTPGSVEPTLFSSSFDSGAVCLDEDPRMGSRGLSELIQNLREVGFQINADSISLGIDLHQQIQRAVSERGFNQLIPLRDFLEVIHGGVAQNQLLHPYRNVLLLHAATAWMEQVPTSPDQPIRLGGAQHRASAFLDSYQRGREIREEVFRELRLITETIHQRIDQKKREEIKRREEEIKK